MELAMNIDGTGHEVPTLEDSVILLGFIRKIHEIYHNHLGKLWLVDGIVITFIMCHFCLKIYKSQILGVNVSLKQQ